jgi:hypothetical protein
VTPRQRARTRNLGGPVVEARNGALASPPSLETAGGGGGETETEPLSSSRRRKPVGGGGFPLRRLVLPAEETGAEGGG